MLELEISEVSKKIREGEISPLELVQATLERIESLNPRLNSFITIVEEQAIAEAKRATEAISVRRELGPLHGIPIGLKDLFHTKGIRTTSGSKAFRDFVPPTDATVVERLKRAGAIIVGKHNMHEFAMGGTNKGGFFGSAINPWDSSRITGGSSGGSAAAVAAQMCFAALGSDTGGSVRIPAALCGVVGLKPTYGRVSRNGVTPSSWSLDHVGPITRSVQDAAILLRVISGYDPADSTSSEAPIPDYEERILAKKSYVVGIPNEFYFESLDPDVEGVLSSALATLKGMGVKFKSVSIPFKDCVPTVVNILISEAYSFHRPWLRERGFDYGPNVQRSLLLGRTILAQDYLQSQRIRNWLAQTLSSIFRDGVDAIVTPSVAIPPPRLDEDEISIGGRSIPIFGELPRLLCLFNLTGFPALSIPCGFTSQGLPVSLQLASKPFAEEVVLQIGHRFQNETDWHKRFPRF